MKRKMLGAIGGALVFFAVVALVALLYFPSLLAFPYKSDIGDYAVYSETPIAPNLAAQLRQADELLSQSDLADSPSHRALFFTNGGLRWRLLSIGYAGSFGLCRRFSNAIVLNASDLEAGVVRNGRPIGGVRTISGVVAHESTHIMAERYLGLRALIQPTWKWEGYADYIAQESSLSDADAANLRTTDPANPSLRYYDYRRRVADFLGRPGRTAAHLFGGERAPDRSS